MEVSSNVDKLPIHRKTILFPFETPEEREGRTQEGPKSSVISKAFNPLRTLSSGGIFGTAGRGGKIYEQRFVCQAGFPFWISILFLSGARRVDLICSRSDEQ